MFILSGVVHFDEEATWDGSFDAVLTWYNSAELIIVHISLTTLCCMQQILSPPHPLNAPNKIQDKFWREILQPIRVLPKCRNQRSIIF